MPNEMIWFIFAAVNFSMLLLFYRLFGKTGLFVWIGFSTVAANLQVIKLVELFGLVATLGNIMYGTVFLATDILNEKYGKKEARKAVWFGFSSLLAVTIIMQFVLAFQPHADDMAHEHLSFIFELLPQVVIASLLAYLISQLLDVQIYAIFKKVFHKPSQLWMRNSFSTAISQFIDTVIFCSIAFYGWYEFGVWLEVLLTTYFIKFIVAAIDTPFIYIARKLNPKEN
ncbi:queuosine precursor transporter [Salipaludibacillus sp. CUR1]|uniref:queuosine precursor transporter n=1 Tax=Salipaludibacillus sp. CUR1 TaxID=2820003 RepID=UPI001E60D244|nr:queuosine precursor transporter [Salipaludibacillus sp. CUR1]MCE7793239.1 queuosine precursor transporter [Salipaludibacillus sp. CUR1]